MHVFNAPNSANNTAQHIRNIMPISRSMAAAVFVVGCCSILSTARADLRLDPMPAMTWEKLKQCELVVVGHYTQHKDRLSMTLKVDRVLKGTRVKAGDPLTLTLHHWYSIETELTGLAALIAQANDRPLKHFRRTHKPLPERSLIARANDKPPKQVPMLCYKEQLSNPGATLPVKVLSDVRQPAIYFIEKESELGLVVQQQVQPAFWADDWEALLSNKEAGIMFRVSHAATSKKAFEQIKRERDPAVIQQHLAWLVKPPKSNWTRWRSAPSSMAFLLTVGDKDGDVYDPLIKQIQTGEWPGGVTADNVARVCARVAPDRAWKDFEEILVDRPHWVVANMCFTGKPASVDKAFELLEDPDMRHAAKQAICSALPLYSSSFVLPPNQIQLRQHALPLVRKALASDKVNEHDKAELRGLFQELLRNQK